jgi:tRNA-specific 2-thiouridylase
MKKQPTVYVALSGGVDSSVAAALLKKKGYNVVGVFMKNWEGNPELGYCPWEEDQKMVGRVSKHLGIPWKTWNFSRKYEEKVISPFFSDYKMGLTPNPDTVCNKEIKFGAFLRRALSEGADFIATGHYAKIKKARGRYLLEIPKDKHKDQTYFLYQLSQKQLSKVLFPLGGYTKTQVRKIAENMGLPNAERPDSQGICFVGEVSMKEFLSHRLPKKSGSIVTTDGKVIGKHDGVWFYTIGQRYGLQIGGGIPYYVVDKDIKTNTLIVSPGLASDLYQREMVVGDLNWIAEAPKRGQILVRFRHGQDLQRATIDFVNERNAVVRFAVPQRAIAPGQAAVFYRGKTLLGGGVIRSRSRHMGNTLNRPSVTATMPVRVS